MSLVPKAHNTHDPELRSIIRASSRKEQLARLLRVQWDLTARTIRLAVQETRVEASSALRRPNAVVFSKVSICC